MTEFANVVNVPVPGSPRFQQDTAMAIARLRASLGPTGIPTYSTIALTGLTSSRLLASDDDKSLSSADLSDWLSGTTNQVSVTDDGDGTVTLAIPQDIHTGASPTFAGLTSTGDIELKAGQKLYFDG
jgi:hypothetical protein